MSCQKPAIADEIHERQPVEQRTVGAGEARSQRRDIKVVEDQEQRVDVKSGIADEGQALQSCRRLQSTGMATRRPDAIAGHNTIQVAEQVRVRQ